MIDTNAVRKKLLSLAIQGSLSVQDSHDNVNSLYKELIEKKNKRNIKNNKNYDDITDEEKSVSIPNNWIWVRLGEIS